MSTPMILDFYRANVGHPNSVPYRKYIHWDTNSSAILTIQPSSTETIVIREIGWWFDNSADLASNRRVRLLATQSSPPPSGSIDLILNTANDIFGAMNLATLHKSGHTTVGVMCFDPPIKVGGASENITVRYEDSSSTPDTNGIDDGNIRIVAIGWALLTANY